MRKTRYVIAAVASGVLAAVAFAAVAGAQPAGKAADSHSRCGLDVRRAARSPSGSSSTRAAPIQYDPIGSGGGIQQITARTVDFGASDAPMTFDQLIDLQRLRR